MVIMVGMIIQYRIFFDCLHPKHLFLSVTVTYYSTMADVVGRLKQVTDDLECQFGLLIKLQAKELLTYRQLADVKSKRTAYKQNEKLVDFIVPLLVDQGTYNEFLSALHDTGQSHLANHITGSKKLISRCQ